MKRKILSILLALFLITSNTTCIYASYTAGSVVIAGGTTGIGGFSGGYINSIGATGIILSFLSSMGFTIHLTEAAKQAGETAAYYVQNLLKQWIKSITTPGEIDTSSEWTVEDQVIYEGKLADFFSGVEGGSGGSGGNGNEVGPDGKIFLTGATLEMLRQFCNYLKEKGILTDELVSDHETVNGDIYTNLLETTTSNQNYLAYQYYALLNNENIKCGYFKLKSSTNSNDYQVVLYVPKNVGRFTACKKVVYENLSSRLLGTYSAVLYENWYYYSVSVNTDGVNGINEVVGLRDITAQFGSVQSGGIENYLDSLGDIWDVQEGASENNYIEGNYTSSDLENQNGSYTEIDPGLLQALQDQAENGQQLNMNLQEYMKALNEMYNKQANSYYQLPSGIPANDVSTGSQQLLNYPSNNPVPSVKLPDAEQIPGENNPTLGSVPTTDYSTPPPADVSVPRMMFALDEYFPFCIPFDIHALFMKLQGTPQAPSYTFEFTEPFSGAHIVMPIDLSIFNDAMITVRKVEVVLYIVCLAVASRKFYAR